MYGRTQQNQKPIRFSRRRRMIAILAAGVVGVALVVAGTQSIRTTINRINNEYAAEHAAEMLTEFLAKHHRWPRDWEELHGVCAVAIPDEKSRDDTFQNVKERVWIDFDVTPEQLRAAIQAQQEEPPILLRLRSGERAVWYGADLNKRVLDHLRSPTTGLTNKQVGEFQGTP